MSVLVIAEAGVNHNGDIELAKKMITEAKKAGADYIKFQTFVPEKLVSRFADKAEYQKKTTGSDQSQLEMLQKLALKERDFIELQHCCKAEGIGFISTPFDLESIAFLDGLNMDFWKLPSGEITNLPYLEAIGKTKKKVVMSTGMSELDEIQAAICVLEQNGCKDITVLHCNTEYPTPFCDVNLLAMDQMRTVLQKPVGYSDHTVGIEVATAAAALGAVVIEKHFTLDKTMEGPDHKASLEPKDLKAMVDAIRNVEKSLGNAQKKRSASEQKNCDVARKSIVAAKEIMCGEKFSIDNLTTKRPGTGISPMKWYDLLGGVAKKSYKTDECIEEMELK